MDNLYNPDQMSEQEVKDTFVARQPLVDELHALVARQPDGAGVQHVVVIAPRGMGKTTLLRMVQFAVREDPDLAGKWLAIKFPEELFGVTDLADFWLETLFLISAETGDEALRTRAETLRRDYPESDRLREVGLATIRDWRRKSGQRLLLLVENLDALFSKMRDDRDLAFLRDALMNDGTLMLVGGATTFFQEINDYGQPLYNFFKIHNLSDLKSDEIEELLSRRAQLDAVADFGEKLAKNRSGLRAIEHFTGGNPRLALMLYRVVTQSDLGEVKVLLEKLLDEVTPYYKAKTESLPPQQQKILDAITRVSARTNQGVTPTEIAEIVRLAPNQVSSLLKRLVEGGYVRAANVREKHSYYMLSEPLYVLWHQMRFGRNESERFQWIVNWLRVLYQPEELVGEATNLLSRLKKRLSLGNFFGAREVVDHLEIFLNIVGDSNFELYSVLKNFCNEARKEVISAELEMELKIGDEFFDKEVFEKALVHFNKALKLNPENNSVKYKIGLTKLKMDKFDEAICIGESLIKSAPKNFGGYSLSILGLIGAEQLEKAIEKFESMFICGFDAHDFFIQGKLLEIYGDTLEKIGKFEEAIAAYKKSLGLIPDQASLWFKTGQLIKLLQGSSDAEGFYIKWLSFEPVTLDEWVERGFQWVEKLFVSVLVTFNIDKKVFANGLKNTDSLLFLESEKFLSSIKNVFIDENKLNVFVGEAKECLNEFNFCFEKSFNLNQNNSLNFFKCISDIVLFSIYVKEENYSISKEYWLSSVKFAKTFNQIKIWKIISERILVTLASQGKASFVRDIIIESETEEIFFPIVRAIDYVKTGESSLIEKLSPEVRVIVEGFVEKFRPNAPAIPEPPKKKKTPRKRVRPHKHL